jgi:hypothetical protein
MPGQNRASINPLRATRLGKIDLEAEDRWLRGPRKGRDCPQRVIHKSKLRIAQWAVSAAGNFTGSDFTPRNTNESSQAGSPTSSAGYPSARSSAGSAICASSRASGAPKQKWMP